MCIGAGTVVIRYVKNTLLWSGCDGLGVTGGEWFLSVCGWLADLCCVLRLLDCVCVRVVVNI